MLKLYLTLCVALILAGSVSLDSAFPQAGTTETTRQGEESPSQKEPADTRSRNPFLLPWGVYLLSKEGAASAHREKVIGKDAKLEEMETSLFKVRAILISDQIRLATIGSQIVAVGDEINGEKILEIKKDQVILGKGDKKRTLHLQQSPLRLTTEAPSPSSLTRGEDRKGVQDQKKEKDREGKKLIHNFTEPILDDVLRISPKERTAKTNRPIETTESADCDSAPSASAYSS